MKMEHFDVRWDDKWKDSLLVKWLTSCGISVVPHLSLLEYNSFYEVVYIRINDQFVKVVDKDWFTKYVIFEKDLDCFDENDFFEKYRGKRIRIRDTINNCEQDLIVPKDEIELELLKLSLGKTE